MSEIKVLITSFGSFSALEASKTNPSHLIASALPPSMPHPLHPGIHNIKLILPAQNPLPAEYHSLSTLAPKLIDEHNPDIILHMGLATDQEYFAVEKSAKREGYHEIPDGKKKVFTRAENKKAFRKGAERLETEFDIDAVVGRVVRGFGHVRQGNQVGSWSKGGKGKGAGKQLNGGDAVDIRATDHVGNFVCGFIYYVSLLEMQKKGRKRNVVFLHTPMLESEEGVSVGVRVLNELVKALVDEFLEQESTSA